MKSYFLTTALLAASCLSTPACSSPPSSVSTPASSAAPATPAPQVEQPDGIVLSAGARRIEQAQVRMRDGARLNADVYLPAATGRFPVVLIRTPYKTEIGPRPVFLNKLIEAGYAIVQQHERGRFLSEGDMRMLGRADEDGWDTLDWI